MTATSQLFASMAAWQVFTSGLARLELKAARSPWGPALRMDYDFGAGGGFVVARRALRLSMPQRYRLRLRLRGRAPANHLEIKLVDASGQSVWRHLRRSLRAPRDWRSLLVPERDIEFAWGPAGGGRPVALSAVELAVVADVGGSGSLWLADFDVEALPPEPPIVWSASSAMPGHGPDQADRATAWMPDPGDARPWLQLDFGSARDFGGLSLDWPAGAPAAGFSLQASTDGRRWRRLHQASRAAGEHSALYLPDARARLLRLRLNAARPVARLRVEDYAFSRSIHDYWEAVADAAPRGHYPRWLLREQSLWTPFGIADGRRCALLNEEGAVEPDEAAPLIEPLLWIDGRRYTWADAVTTPGLEQGWAPAPSLRWETPDWALEIRCETTVGGMPRLRYRLSSHRGTLSARLFLLLRPFQVTPPWQNIRDVGGVARIHALAWDAQAQGVRVNGALRLLPLTPAAGFGALGADEGDIVAALGGGALPARAAVEDRFGFACGALRFDLVARPGMEAEARVACPTAQACGAPDAPAFDWTAAEPAPRWSAAGWGMDALTAMRTAAAHILVTRSGPSLQPGPRRYARSWIRDGAVMASALLRMGWNQAARAFADWYAPYQRADGFVPCCVDRNGPDWLVEHDSHGQLLALIAQVHAFVRDDAWLRALWPRVEAAVGYLQAALGADGLMPISASHEGYLAQPVHSYWDGFWTLRGIGDAAAMARLLQHEDQADRWSALATRVADALYASIRSVCAARALAFIPGSLEWADLDPTATANAVNLLDVPAGLDRAALEHSFDLHMQAWRARRAGDVDWANYSPYEIRIVGALVRLGRRAEALELLRFYLDERRPRAWNQWPEIAWRATRAPAHLGDLPHTWIAAEYVLALQAMFVYEREPGPGLVLAAGIAPEWLDGEGVALSGVPTRDGALTLRLWRIDAGSLGFAIEAAPGVPLELRPPLPGRLAAVELEAGGLVGFDAHSVRLAPAPARGVLRCVVPTDEHRLNT